MNGEKLLGRSVGAILVGMLALTVPSVIVPPAYIRQEATAGSCSDYSPDPAKCEVKDYGTVSMMCDASTHELNCQPPYIVSITVTEPTHVVFEFSLKSFNIPGYTGRNSGIQVPPRDIDDNVWRFGMGGPGSSKTQQATESFGAGTLPKPLFSKVLLDGTHTFELFSFDYTQDCTPAPEDVPTKCSELGVSESWSGTLKAFVTPGQDKNDLAIKELSVVQAPSNPEFLVDGKSTLVQAKIKNTFTTSKTISIALTYPGSSNPTVVNNFVANSGESNRELAVIKPTGSNKFDLTVEIDSGHSVTELDERDSSNKISMSLPMEKTNDLRVIFVPVRVQGDSDSKPSCDENPSISNDVRTFANNVVPYLRATYPLTNVEAKIECVFNLRAAELRVPSDVLDRNRGATGKLADDELGRLWRTLDEHAARNAQAGYTVIVVGVAKTCWIGTYHPGQECSTVGIAPKSDSPTKTMRSAIVELKPLSEASTASQEIGHIFGWVTNDTDEDNLGHFTRDAGGYWVERAPNGQRQFPQLDFMYRVPQNTNGLWVSKETFRYLADQLAPGKDPNVILISGYVLKDGTAVLQRLERFEDIVDIALDSTGEYQLSFLDVSGNILAKTGFDPAFYVYDVGPVNYNAFNIRVPDVEGTHKAVLQKDGQVLAESTFEAGSGGGSGDTTPPAITVPENIVVEATSADGAAVTYNVTAQDNVDGTATLEEDGTTIAQDAVGGNITISCAPVSGSLFPIGETTVDCNATDAVGNQPATPTSFKVTVSQFVPPNNAPVASDDTATTSQGVAVTIDVLANDIDPDNDPLTIASVTNPANGGTAVIENGKTKYTPGIASFTGTDQFQYTVSDGKEGGTDTATVTVTVKDTTPPDTTIDSAKDGNGNTITADGTTSSDSVTFTFSSPDSDVDKYQCSIDSSSLQDCTSPKTYGNLAQDSHIFEVIAADTAGNADPSAATFSWKVEQPPPPPGEWTIKGFYPPVDMVDANGDPIVNTIKSGRSVPLKFEVFDENGVELTSTGTDVITSFNPVSISCATLADDSTDAIEVTSTGGTSLTYDSTTGQYIQNWKTPSNSAGKCFKADLTTADGTHTVAYFKMTK